jgi:hypothetical protein
LADLRKVTAEYTDKQDEALGLFQALKVGAQS